ncbi:MAG: Gfo/Idh/MocA family oxidoreductase [Acidobacteriaceae bacterium]|nr:Gfo/Idh/MocA family oxidoreductase [Acidobacteriaceae bacterium]
MKVGVVGCGRVSEHHLRFLTAHPGTQVVGLVDVNLENARALGGKHGVSAVYSNLEEFLETARPDVVHIATPPDFHYAQAKEAIQHGVHVLVEKPTALSAAETADLYERAEANGVTICPDFSQLFHPSMQHAMALIQSGRLGPVIRCEANLTLDVNIRETREAQGLHWSYQLPCGIFHNYITHPLYLALHFVGRPKQVLTTPRSFGALPQGLTDHLEISLEGERISGRVVVSFAASRAYYVKIFCKKGTIFVDFENVVTVVQQDSRLPRAINRVSGNFRAAYQLSKGSIGNVIYTLRKKLVPYHGLRTLIEQYYASLREGKTPPVSRDLTLAVGEAEEAIHSAAGKIHLDLSSRPSRQEDISRPEKLLVTGGTGHLGVELVRQLVRSGYYVRALVRPLSRIEDLERLGVEIVYGDIRNDNAVRDAANQTDIIIHVAAGLRGSRNFILESCVQGIRNIVEAAKSNRVKRVIYVSSMSVYDFNSIPNGSTVTELSPLEVHPELRGASSMAKREAEDIALEQIGHGDPAWTILRPTGFFGNGHKLSITLGVRMGSFLICLGTGSKRLRLIHVADVSDAIIKVIENTGTENRVFNVAHQDRLTLGRYIKNCVRKSGRVHVVYIPYWVAYLGLLGIRALRRITGKGPSMNVQRLRYLYSSIEVDSRPLREETAWQCAGRLEDQLAAELNPRRDLPTGTVQTLVLQPEK